VAAVAAIVAAAEAVAAVAVAIVAAAVVAADTAIAAETAAATKPRSVANSQKGVSKEAPFSHSSEFVAAVCDRRNMSKG
jgi:predicted house-cleaning NTP pyrophosphatase (Maf/HAM1 superfamily)